MRLARARALRGALPKVKLRGRDIDAMKLEGRASVDLGADRQPEPMLAPHRACDLPRGADAGGRRMHVAKQALHLVIRAEDRAKLDELREPELETTE